MIGVIDPDIVKEAQEQYEKGELEYYSQTGEKKKIKAEDFLKAFENKTKGDKEMGRPKKQQEVSEDVKALDTIVKKDKELAVNKELTIKEVELAYSGGADYDFFRLQEEIMFYQEQAGSAFIEIGKRLIRIKAHEEHGGFMQALEKTGIAQSTANYAMSAARKFGNVQSTGHLGSEKLRALTVLEDTDIEELDKGGEVFGMKLDDIDKMSTRELRKKLREEREKRKQEKDAREQVIKQKEAKLNELEEQLRYLPPATKRDTAKAELEKLRKVFFGEINITVFQYLRMSKLFSIAQSLDGVDFPMLEEFENSLSDDITRLAEAREQFFDNYENPHVLSKKEQKERGLVIDNGDIEGLINDRKY